MDPGLPSSSKKDRAEKGEHAQALSTSWMREEKKREAPPGRQNRRNKNTVDVIGEKGRSGGSAPVQMLHAKYRGDKNRPTKRKRRRGH